MDLIEYYSEPAHEDACILCAKLYSIFTIVMNLPEEIVVNIIIHCFDISAIRFIIINILDHIPSNLDSMRRLVVAPCRPSSNPFYIFSNVHYDYDFGVILSDLCEKSYDKHERTSYCEGSLFSNVGKLTRFVYVIYRMG